MPDVGRGSQSIFKDNSCDIPLFEMIQQQKQQTTSPIPKNSFHNHLIALQSQMAAPNKEVVASLPERSTDPLRSISLSPSRRFGVIAGKDNLQLVRISPDGLKTLRLLKISQVCALIASTVGSAASFLTLSLPPVFSSQCTIWRTTIPTGKVR